MMNLIKKTSSVWGCCICIIFLLLIPSFTIYAEQGETVGIPFEAIEADVQLSTKKKTIYVGKSFGLKLENAVNKDDIQWRSSDEAVAVVESGTVIALSAGKCNVIASYNGIDYQCKITVKEPYVEVSLGEINVGDSFTVELKGATPIKFTSSDKTVISIDSEGSATALRAGKVDIRIVDKSGKKYTYTTTVYDRGKNQIESITKKVLTDDVWLTQTYKHSWFTLPRNTGLKILSPIEDGYKVYYKGFTFDVKEDMVTTVAPAAVAYSGLRRIDYEVTPGMLVNYNSCILSTGDPLGLIALKDSDITKHLDYSKTCMLQEEVITPLSAMIDECWKAGVRWFQVTAKGTYRSYTVQNTLWNNRINKNPSYGDDPYNNGGTKCVPGVSSEHRTGYAIDIKTTDAGYDWLNANCYKYGFILRYTGDKTMFTGVMDEYWHYTYVGKPVAETCFKEKICLEEYYNKYVYE